MLQTGDCFPGNINSGNSFGLQLPWIFGALPDQSAIAVWDRRSGIMESIHVLDAAQLAKTSLLGTNAWSAARARAEHLNKPFHHLLLAANEMEFRPFCQPGRLSLVIDGQFGSTGKGLISSWIGARNRIDIAVSNAAPNAGHSFFVPGDPVKKVTRLLPVAAIFNPESRIYLCAGAVIDADLLLTEIEAFGIDRRRVVVHPRAALIEEIDIEAERAAGSSVAKIASTQKGVGSALAHKIMRSSKLAAGCEKIKDMIGEIDLQAAMQAGQTVYMEVPQGLDLAINSGLSYPHCTSREITVTAALADAQVHPDFLGSVMLSLRTFPIRVGDLTADGERYSSGPFYPDSREISWAELGMPEERTTVTNRIRRVATFSMQQYQHAIQLLKPSHVFMNFMNYIESEVARIDFLNRCNEIRTITHIGMGSSLTDVTEISHY